MEQVPGELAPSCKRRPAAGLQRVSASSNQQDFSGKENADGELKLCHGCGEPMAKSRHLINLAGLEPERDQYWHPECFRCAVCQLLLAHEHSCHLYKDQIICRADYAKLQRGVSSARCARCRWPVAASDWVRRAAEHVYHLACFTCDLCLRQLSTGEQFTLSGGGGGGQEPSKLICRLHFAIDHDPQPAPQPQPQVAPIAGMSSSGQASPAGASFGAETPVYTCPQGLPEAGAPADRSKFSAEQYLHFLVASQAGAASSAGCQQQAQLDPAEALAADNLDDSQCLEDLKALEPIGGLGSGCSSNGSLGGGGGTGAISGGGGGGSSKSKRVRTTFTEDQLSILQTHFQIDSNPDGQDLERIATITGLSKRVTQVWFQNSRARQKKYLIKRKPSHLGSTQAAAGLSCATDDNTQYLAAPGAQLSQQQQQQQHQQLRWPHPHPEAGGHQSGGGLTVGGCHEAPGLGGAEPGERSLARLAVDEDDEGEDEGERDDEQDEDEDEQEYRDSAGAQLVDHQELAYASRKQHFRN